MKSHRIERSFSVEGDLFDIAIFIAAGNPEAALRFLDAAEATFKQLAAMPGMGRFRQFKDSRLQNLRSWRIEGFENYLVFYIPTPLGIQILRVLHGAQDLEKLFSS